MQTALAVITWWLAVNLVVAAIWTWYRLRPRRRYSWKLEPRQGLKH
jgi:uncharacterized protein (DUF2062 family)